MKPVIEVKGLSKVYQIGHDDRPAAGSATFRDTLTNLAKKPIEIFTGHKIAQEEFWALKNVDFEVQHGDVVGIIGRNGSGKSTLLKILSRIVEPTSGEIIMRGRVASLLEVGTGFHPELTGRENIFFNGAILGMSQKEIRAKFDDIVEFSEVEKFLDTPVKFYSSGMYVRLAFSVAAHLDPDILIVDEVLAVGDAAFQKKCLGKMRDVAGQGRTVLFVSHNLSAVEALCDKGVHMSGGTIVKHGTIKSAVASYLDVHANLSGSTIYTEPRIDRGGRVSRVTTFNEKGEPNGVIPFGRKWKAKVEFIISKPARELTLALGLKNAADVPVRTNWSKKINLEPGKYIAEFNFGEIFIESGNYVIAVGISESGNSIYFDDTSSSIRISEDGNDDPRILQKSGSGILLDPVDVAIRPEK